MSRPPAMLHGASDMHAQGKLSEVLPLLRMMCGSLQNMDVEITWIKVLLKMQGPDGILYTPTTGRDWIIANIPEGYPEDASVKHFPLIVMPEKEVAVPGKDRLKPPAECQRSHIGDDPCVARQPFATERDHRWRCVDADDTHAALRQVTRNRFT